MTEYNWIVDDLDNVVMLERVDPITNSLSYAVVSDKKALDNFFRVTDTGDLVGIVPDRYVKEYKNYVKRNIGP